MEWLSDPQIWLALATLTALEIILGIDNIIFIAILAGKLPEEQRKKARTMGLGLAMLTVTRPASLSTRLTTTGSMAVRPMKYW